MSCYELLKVHLKIIKKKATPYLFHTGDDNAKQNVFSYSISIDASAKIPFPNSLTFNTEMLRSDLSFSKQSPC